MHSEDRTGAKAEKPWIRESLGAYGMQPLASRAHCPVLTHRLSQRRHSTVKGRAPVTGCGGGLVLWRGMT